MRRWWRTSCFLKTPPPGAGGPGDIPDTHAEEGPRGAVAAAAHETGPGHQN